MVDSGCRGYIRIETLDVYTLRRAGREQRKHLMDCTGKEANCGDAASHHHILPGSSSTLYPTSSTAGIL